MKDQDSSQDFGEKIISKLQELNKVLDKILKGGEDGKEKLPDSSSS